MREVIDLPVDGPGKGLCRFLGVAAGRTRAERCGGPGKSVVRDEMRRVMEGGRKALRSRYRRTARLAGVRG